MEQKTKIIILVAIMLTAVVVGAVYFNLKKNSQPAQTVQAPQKPSKSEAASSAAKQGSYQEAQPDMKTVAVTGEVVVAAKDSIEISNGGVKNVFSLSSNVLVISIKDGKAASKTIADIKVGDQVTIVINSANSEVVGIQMGNEA